jgi:hypothetical protein
MQFIQVYEKAFSDEYCNQVIEFYNVAEQNGMTLNRQEHDGAPKTDKEDTLATFTKLSIRSYKSKTH